jgi:hypothetical protein
MERYIDTRSELDTSRLAPIVVKIIIREYSLTVGTALVPCVGSPTGAQPSSRIAPTKNRNVSIPIDTVVT